MRKTFVGLVCSFFIAASAAASCPPGYSEPCPQEPIQAPSQNDLAAINSECYQAYLDKVNALYEEYLADIARVCGQEGNCYKEPCAGVWCTLYRIHVQTAYESYLECVNSNPIGYAVEPCPQGYITIEPEPGYPAPSIIDPGDKDGGYSRCYLDYTAKLQEAYEKYRLRMRSCLRFPGMNKCYDLGCATINWTYYLLAINDAKNEYEWCVLELNR